MEVYNVPEHAQSDAYLIQNTESNSQFTGPHLQQLEAMYNEGAPELIVDQGLYYPPATNYGYICTGFESPGDWDDHQRIFGLDGQDIQYAGAQTESLPYVYYTPSYGYAQSPYNPYNPYIPGAMIGVDGPFVGAQPYYPIPSYENPVSSPAYFPVVVQPGSDIISNGTPGPFIDVAASTARGADAVGHKSNFYSYGPASRRSNSVSKLPEGSKTNAGSSKQSMAHATVSGTPSQALQSRGAQTTENFSYSGKVISTRTPFKVAAPQGNGLSNYGSTAHVRPTIEKTRPKLLYERVTNDVKVNLEALAEQNRGPRTNKPRTQLAVKAYTTKAGSADAQGNIIIYTDLYNKDDFPVDYVNAKFFVIKSYSEDDVHKSIKYNVWSSTPNGNKKLNSAYDDAQRVAVADSRGCPIFLFFSVNASGQFCGVAEMTGPVDFHKDMDFWQQDKWSGSFPVKWHIIKDVPNSNFRHVILENNENKPVTNSRDTQEIRYKKGIEMLKIFKNYTSKTSLLDDFMYYENRQKILQEEKTRLLSKRYDSSFLMPVLDPPRKLNPNVELPSNVEEKTTQLDLSGCGKSSSGTIEQAPVKKADANKSTIADERKAHLEPVRSGIDDALKIGSLTINPRHSESVLGCPGPATDAVSMATSESTSVVTVGSVPVKVNGLALSSGFLTVGTIPLDPRALQCSEVGLLSKTKLQNG